MFFPKGFCAQYLGGRAQEIEGFNCFKHVTDLLDADIIAVPSLSRLNDRVPRNVLGDQKVELLHTDMLVARVLGKRVAEPEFFRQVHSRRLSTLSTNMDEVRHWGNGLQVKCRAVCLIPNFKKLVLNVSSEFTQRHQLLWQVLLHAANLNKSRWTIMNSGRPSRRKREEAEVKDISHVSDLDTLVGRDAILDKTAAADPKADPLAHVLLRTKATANAQSSGGA